MPRPTREQVLAEIRESALRLFVEQGYEATTLAQVGASVGYSKSAMLYHFASKETLLAEALREPLRRLREYVDRARELTPLEQLEGLVDLVLAHRHEATLLLTQGHLMAQLEPAATAADDVAELFLGADPSLAHRVAVHVALSGLAETVVCMADVPSPDLRGPLLSAAARAMQLVAQHA